MEEWGRVIADWLWTVVTALGAWLALLGRRVGLLERNTLTAPTIDEKLDKLEARLIAQHSELKAEIHQMNAENSSSRERIYDKIDDLRADVVKQMLGNRS